MLNNRRVGLSTPRAYAILGSIQIVPAVSYCDALISTVETEVLVVKHFGLIILVLGVLVGCRPAETPARTPVDSSTSQEEVSLIYAYDDDGRRLTAFEAILRIPDRQFSSMGEGELWYYKRELSEEQLAQLPEWRREKIISADPEIGEWGVPVLRFENSESIAINESNGRPISVFEYLQGMTAEDVAKHPEFLRNSFRQVISKLSADELIQVDTAVIEFLRDEE
jgi:hypothetical protein